MWEDSSYCWVVTCKNHLYHIPRNFIYRHKIPLAETDGAASRPPVKAPFKVRCDSCGKRIRISECNQLLGRILEIKTGDLMAQVRILSGDHELTSLVTAEMATDLWLNVGDEVVVLLKPTQIMIVREAV